MDNLDEISYNKPNVNDDVAPETGTVVERIDKSKLQNVTVPGCTHPRTKVSPADDEYDAPTDEVSCLDCPWGIHVRRLSS